MTCLQPLLDDLNALDYQQDYLITGRFHGHYVALQVLVNEEAFKEILQNTILFLKQVALQSEATFKRYRNEIERFLLWRLTEHSNQQTAFFSEPEIINYCTFVRDLPRHWRSDKIEKRFVDTFHKRQANPNWRPFSHRYSAENYETRAAMFTALNAFGSYLVSTKVICSNPVKHVRSADSVLSQQQKTSKNRQIAIALCDLHSLCSRYPNDLTLARALCLYASVNYASLQLSDFSLSNNWQTSSLHLKRDGLLVVKRLHCLKEIKLTPEIVELWQHYFKLRGITTHDDVPLLHRNRGTGDYEVRQLRRMLRTFESELKNQKWTI